MSVYLFLDFDGVLHKNGGKRFEHIDIFAKAIQKYDVKIVFSTSWREYSSVAKLSAYLPESLKDKCVGLTPMIKENIKSPRYHEILQYIENNNVTEEWIAIDDMRVLFPLFCKNLFLVDGSEGFTTKYIKLLRDRIEKLEKV
jgi:hypothetical protein